MSRIAIANLSAVKPLDEAEMKSVTGGMSLLQWLRCKLLQKKGFRIYCPPRPWPVWPRVLPR